MLKKRIALLLAGCMLLMTVGCVAVKTATEAIVSLNEELTAVQTEEPKEPTVDEFADAYMDKVDACRELLKGVADGYLQGKKPDQDTLNRIETLDGEIDELYKKLKYDSFFGGDKIKSLQEHYKAFYDTVLNGDHNSDSYEVLVSMANILVLGDESSFSGTLTDYAIQKAYGSD